MLAVEHAIAQILADMTRLETETIALNKAFGRVLATDITSPVSLPPFANSSMDGYAVRAADTQGAPVTLRVVMDIPAGRAPAHPLAPGEAARIMTGAPMPDGADAVVPVEDTDAGWGQSGDAPLAAQVTILKAVRGGAFVRAVGENVRAGQTLLTAATTLRPQDVGMLASVGLQSVPVVRQPRVVILTTGDELIPAGTPLTPGKIYDANNLMLAGLARQDGALALVLPPAPDDLPAVETLFREALSLAPDMIVSSAGVSVGAADYVRTVLEALGEINFWRINLRPGKPLAYGRLYDGSGRAVPFFGLPGNPVSAIVTFEVIVRPALAALLGREFNPAEATAITGEAMTSDGRRSYLRVRLSRDGQRLIAHSTGTQSSGALMSMVEADGLLIVPEGVTQVPAGTALPVRLLRESANFR